MSKKGWSAFAAIVVLICLCVWWVLPKEPVKTEYTVGEVKALDMREKIDATGTIEPLHRVDLSATVGGKLRKVYVHENDAVAKGQVVALIESPAAESRLRQAESTLINKQSALFRYEELFRLGAISAEMLDDRRLAYESATAEYDRAKGDFEDTVVVSPIAGTVIGEPMQEGETLSLGLSNQMVIATVADLTNLRIKLAVDETDIGRIQVGQSVSFTVDAYPKEEFHGKVTDISRRIPNNSSTTVIYYTVYVTIDSADVAQLYPGMTARATVYGRQVDQVPVIPITALRSGVNGQYVFRRVADGFEKIPVTLGVVDDMYAEIVEGLSIGDEIIVNGRAPEETGESVMKRRFRI